MSIVYDFDPKKHTDAAGIVHSVYRNNPNRYLVQAREREARILTTFRGVRRRIFRWTRWRTVERCPTKERALEAMETHGHRNSLAEWRVTWGGKKVDK